MKSVSIALFAGVVGWALVQPHPAAATFREKVLYSFCSQRNCADGANPYASLIDVNGTLYGTTLRGGVTRCNGNGCGTVFSFDPATGTEKALYAFCSQQNCTDGTSPYAGLIDLNGTLYGTTFSGGTGGDGTAFALDQNSGAEKVLYSFCSQQNCADGANPFASLISVSGTLYGTTDGGGTGYHGSSLYGTAFALNPSTGVETVLYSFCQQQSCTDGQNPASALIELTGMLYGTTASGGAYSCGNGNGCGTVFSLDPSTGAETVLHSFGNGTDGRLPSSSLIDVNGTLYGTTYGGGRGGCGAFGCGTVFSVDPNTGAEKVLYAFCSQQANCADGANPYAGLIAVNGMLYGTTYAGGRTGCTNSNPPGCGTVFSLDPSTGAKKVLHSFAGGTDGANPYASLLAVNGKFYGTTYAGGGAGCGGAGCGAVFVLKKKR